MVLTVIFIYKNYQCIMKLYVLVIMGVNSIINLYLEVLNLQMLNGEKK